MNIYENVITITIVKLYFLYFLCVSNIAPSHLFFSLSHNKAQNTLCFKKKHLLHSWTQWVRLLEWASWVHFFFFSTLFGASSGKLPAWRRGLLDNLGWDHPKASSLTYLRVILDVDRDFPRLLTGPPTHGICRWSLHMTTSGSLPEHHRASLPL